MWHVRIKFRRESNFLNSAVILNCLSLFSIVIHVILFFFFFLGLFFGSHPYWLAFCKLKKHCCLSYELQAVQEYYYRVRKTESSTCNVDTSLEKALRLSSKRDLTAFDDDSLVLVTESDLDGYDENLEYDLGGNNVLAELNLACRVQFAGQAAIARLSCLWLRCNSGQKTSGKNLEGSVTQTQLENIGVDIHVYWDALYWLRNLGNVLCFYLVEALLRGELQ